MAIPGQIQNAYFIYEKWGEFAIGAIEHFIDCIIEDRTPLVTKEDGLAVTKIVCAMERSAQTGKPGRSELPLAVHRSI
ncbi:MAG: hypothetical protein ACUVTL_06365 [Thermoproteota archaeon]